jgi:hypothetical protein
MSGARVKAKGFGLSIQFAAPAVPHPGDKETSTEEDYHSMQAPLFRPNRVSVAPLLH